MSTRRSTTETAEQKLSRLQEESDRAQQKAAEMAQAVADAKEESEAEAKRVAEEKQAQEEKRVQDAKKKEDTKKRSEAKKKAKKKTSDDDYEGGGPSKSVRGAADGDQGMFVYIFCVLFPTLFSGSEAEKELCQDASDDRRRRRQHLRDRGDVRHSSDITRGYSRKVE